MNRIIIGVLWAVVSTVFCQSVFSQGFKLKDFKQNLNDGSAFHAPMDAEGHPCGLIKVRSSNPELQFRGDIVGEVENKTNEYWVYMPQGSQSLTIQHPNFLPLAVSFTGYGIDVASKATYILTLEELKYKKEKTGVSIVLKPEDAQLTINDTYLENLSGNGFYQLYLPKGEYVCRFSKEGYRANTQIIQTGKASQNLSIELESVMAELDIKCKTATAEIYIDGELKGNGSWKGALLPGEHQIEAKQKNFNTSKQTVTLSEKEYRSVSLPELKRSSGKLEIRTTPSGLPVLVDGKNVGISPCSVEIETGKHYVGCKSYGIQTNRSDIVVNSGETNKVSILVEYADGILEKQHYRKAYNGDLKSILNLVCEAGNKNNYEEAIEAFFWINRHPQKDYIISHWDSYINNMDEDERPFGYWNISWVHLYQ